jgi:hypothetical protein
MSIPPCLFSIVLESLNHLAILWGGGHQQLAATQTSQLK